jgi:(p)ppGpp synthase/HD superfamily hydrolase
MKFTSKIFHAIKFASKTHQVYQDQKRKGKAIPYITHPMTVGLILSLYGAGEDVICAGILHDTIEDSPNDKKVTREMLVERFGEKVADLVVSATEDKTLPREDRKKKVLEEIANFSHEEVMLKSADVISNMSELLDDHGRVRDAVFERFTDGKDATIKKYQGLALSLIKRWPESPMSEQLQSLSERIGIL